jgi:hypothetical protein
VDLLRWEEKTAQFLRLCIRRPHLQPFRTEAVFILLNSASDVFIYESAGRIKAELK